MLNPRRTRFRKQHRGRMRGISTRGNRICFGKFALQALEPTWITARQIEAGRRAITRYARRGGKLWIRIFPDKPITMRPAETRMGSGKGSPEYWVSVVKPGRILYEISGVSENVARAAMKIAAYKMPIRTQFITTIKMKESILDRKE
uniref:Large ribosomal subunit protein uL16c n=3 Tax=Angiopteris TaxID=3266 RepID=RK16_ANGEV|nr:ribosomal protein L16 [Angiopteris evecta]YP_009117801.1 ribosomal protein L16 [Angiopteris angustifolia]YP_009992468.1 50S ribosomal protein L16 [Angiopteris yunnanensis]A2T371.1 RecName: Full=Large ribosomal subunit protein uL16c; AltName: Full=50S ribosomal protein L16, chloroplastic [Angiopteris evecta]ABG79638.1 ribosomal protein L16 [Angiopteris evecta]AJE71332.1 ribosomal protein L16 [Angiopteris angustifolia]QNN90653.1 50S ribosomal protein L16 [Angiopteris yunnanensis]